MLKIAAFLFAFTGLFLNVQADPITDNPIEENVKIVIDSEKSNLLWTGYKVTGQHNGSVGIESGELTVRDGVLAGGHFVIDMPSITVLDLEGDYRGKLENHLKSEDFFGVEKHPKASLRIGKVTPSGTAGTFKVDGQLTIKDITKPISFEAKVDEQNGMTIATAAIKVDRSKYDIRYRSGSFFQNLGDKAIYDEFDIEVKLVGSPVSAN